MAYERASHFATDVNYEIQRTNHFEVIIPDLNYIHLLVEDVKIPSININTIDLKQGNDTVKVASDPSFDSGDLVIKDAIGVDAERELEQWFHMVYDPHTGEMGLAADYKKTVRLVQWSPDHSVRRAWKCYGVFPTTFDPGGLSNTSPDKKTLSMTLSVDRAVREKPVETSGKKKSED